MGTSGTLISPVHGLWQKWLHDFAYLSINTFRYASADWAHSDANSQSGGNTKGHIVMWNSSVIEYHVFCEERNGKFDTRSGFFFFNHISNKL